MKTLAGIFAPIGTPFREDEEIDFPALEGNMEAYARSGILGYLALGSNGENKSLTEDEKLAVLRTIVAGRAPRPGGDRRRHLRGAARHGALLRGRRRDRAPISACCCRPSYFRKQMTDDVLFRYFATAADRSPIPLLVYNAPGFCGVAVSPGLVGRLGRAPQHRRHEGQRQLGHRVVPRLRERRLPRAGRVGELPLPGDDGAGPSAARCRWPTPSPRSPRAVPSRRGARRGRAGPAFQERCRRLNEAIAGRTACPGVKAAMTLAGLRGGFPRRPLLPLTPLRWPSLRDALVARGGSRWVSDILGRRRGHQPLQAGGLRARPGADAARSCVPYDVNVYDRGLRRHRAREVVAGSPAGSAPRLPSTSPASGSSRCR